MTRESIRAEQEDAAGPAPQLTRVTITAIQDDTVTVTLPGGASAKAPRVSGNVYTVGGLGFALVQEPAIGPVTPIGNAQIQGPKGDTGPQGPQGSPGAASTVPGPKGDKGDTGPAGSNATVTTGEGRDDSGWFTQYECYFQGGNRKTLRREGGIVTCQVSLTLNQGPQFNNAIMVLPTFYQPKQDSFPMVAVYYNGWTGFATVLLGLDGTLRVQAVNGNYGNGMELHLHLTWSAKN